MHAIDLHNHVIPREIIDEVHDNPTIYAAARLAIRKENDGYTLLLGERSFPVEPELYDAQAKIANMERKGINLSVLSPSPLIFLYGLEPEAGLRAARITNDGVAAMVSVNPERLRGMATLPMQDADAAIAELERVVEQHGFRAVEVGATIGSVELSDAILRPVLRRMQELDVVMFTHSNAMGTLGGRLDCYYLANLIGNPLDTTVMAAKLMLSGTLDDLSSLRVLLAHGGGYLPYQIGRIDHGHDVREDVRSGTKTRPTELLRRFWFDSITHHPQALRHLIDMVGPDRVVIGTDSPYDMGEAEPVAALDAVPNLTPAERASITSGAATDLFRGKF